MGDLLLLLAVIILITISAICSGLNVALMSLSTSDLRRKVKMGSNAAKKVLPFRKNSHLSLASILLTNVAVISATSLVLGTRFNGFVAGATSTMLIVIFGEIIPQAFFARHALTFTSRFSPMLRTMITVTYPIAKPLQLALDRVLGNEKSRLHSRNELGIIINEHLGDSASELDEDEVEIIRNALQLSEKRVRDIMKPIEDVYWLTMDTVMDNAKIDEIKQESWSRIPILSRDLIECHGLMLMKDLIDIDFEDSRQLVSDMPLHQCRTVGSMTALDTLFRKFITAKTHLMPVESGDEIVGIVTIEDLIEEILGHEIEDESDHRR